MNRFLYILCLLFVCNVGNSQTLNDIGKIVIGVKVLPTENKETLNSKAYLQNRLIKLSSEYGFTLSLCIDRNDNIYPYQK